MMRSHRRGSLVPAALAACALAASAPAGFGGDWTQWCGRPDRNMVSAETGLPAEFFVARSAQDRTAPDLAASWGVRWIAKLGPRTYASPVIAGGRVYVGSTAPGLAHHVGPAPPGLGKSGGCLFCFSERDGHLLWTLPLAKMPGRKSHHADSGYGICSTPTVEGDRVYILSSRGEVLCLDAKGMADGNDGPFKDEAALMAGIDERGQPNPLIAVDASHGDVIWCCDLIEQVRTRPHDASSSSVLLYGDYLYVGTGNGINERENQVPSPLAPSLVAVNKHTGRLVARDDEVIGTRLYKGQWSSPSLGMADGKPLILYGAGDGCCYAFEPVEHEDAERVLTLRKLWATDCNRPEYQRPDYRRPERPTKMAGPSEIIATPVCVDGRVYAAVGRDPARGRDTGCLNCIEAATGRRLWVYEDIGVSCGSAVVHEGLVYIVETFTKAHCLDARTGEVLWTHRDRGETWGTPLLAEGRLYVATSMGLLIFGAGREGRRLNAVRLDSGLFTSPSAANGTLYLASLGYLYAVRKAPPPADLAARDAPLEPEEADADAVAAGGAATPPRPGPAVVAPAVTLTAADGPLEQLEIVLPLHEGLRITSAPQTLREIGLTEFALSYPGALSAPVIAWRFGSGPCAALAAESVTALPVELHVKVSKEKAGFEFRTQASSYWRRVQGRGDWRSVIGPLRKVWEFHPIRAPLGRTSRAMQSYELAGPRAWTTEHLADHLKSADPTALHWVRGLVPPPAAFWPDQALAKARRILEANRELRHVAELDLRYCPAAGGGAESPEALRRAAKGLASGAARRDGPLEMCLAAEVWQRSRIGQLERLAAAGFKVIQLSEFPRGAPGLVEPCRAEGHAHRPGDAADEWREVFRFLARLAARAEELKVSLTCDEPCAALLPFVCGYLDRQQDSRTQDYAPWTRHAAVTAVPFFSAVFGDHASAYTEPLDPDPARKLPGGWLANQRADPQPQAK